jgi:hypothetical protein
MLCRLNHHGVSDRMVVRSTAGMTEAELLVVVFARQITPVKEPACQTHSM